MYRQLVAGGFLLLISVSVHADAVDLNLGNNSINLLYQLEYGTLDTTLEGVYRQEKDDEPSAALGAIGFEVSGSDSIGNALLEGRVGIKGYGVRSDEYSISALGIGGEMALFPRFGRFGFHLGGYYAPEIVNGLDSERFWAIHTRASFKVLESARIYVGYRVIQAKLDPESDSDRAGETVTVDRGGHIGVNLRF